MLYHLLTIMVVEEVPSMEMATTRLRRARGREERSWKRVVFQVPAQSSAAVSCHSLANNGGNEWGRGRIVYSLYSVWQ